MNVQRCPECGQRLKSNYCDICMRRVSFGGAKPGRYQDPWERWGGSSAHSMERGHECVSFGEDRKVTRAGSSAHRSEKDHECVSFGRKPAIKPQAKRTPAGKMKLPTAVAVIVAVISLLPTLFGIFEDMTDSAPVPPPESEIIYEDVPAIEARELYNDGQIIVTVDHAELSYDDYTVYMTVFNESEEDIIVGTDLLSVNGYMQQASFYADVPEGKAVQEALQLYTWELEEDGITDIGEIAFYLNIYEGDTYLEIARSELITLTTDIADSYEPPMPPNGMELYTGDDVLLRLTSAADDYGDVELQFYLENFSEDTVSISTSGIYINGKIADGYLWETLRPDTCVASTIYTGTERITELAQIEEITLELLIEHLDGYEPMDSRTETITFTP